MHHRSASERRAVAAMLTLVLLLALQPYHIVRTAVLTRHTLAVPHFLKYLAASRFVGEILVKIK